MLICAMGHNPQIHRFTDRPFVHFNPVYVSEWTLWGFVWMGICKIRTCADVNTKCICEEKERHTVLYHINAQIGFFGCQFRSQIIFNGAVRLSASVIRERHQLSRHLFLPRLFIFYDVQQDPYFIFELIMWPRGYVLHHQTWNKVCIQWKTQRNEFRSSLNVTMLTVSLLL